MLEPIVQQTLNKYDIQHEAVACSEELADTARFCEHYGYSLEISANALLIGSTKGEPKFALCLVLAHCRLDTNKVARKKLEVRRLSFATPEQTKDITGMKLGGVTPIGVPLSLPVWIDGRVMQCGEIILGGGNRISKLVLPPDQLLKLPNAEVVEHLALVKS
ncbi:MAG: YbaK/EbsC family protein [Granulosicoccus sp.]